MRHLLVETFNSQCSIHTIVTIGDMPNSDCSESGPEFLSDDNIELSLQLLIGHVVFVELSPRDIGAICFTAQPNIY